MSTKRIIVYPISANPPTWGHADIMMRAANKFDHLYWVAAENPEKKAYFTREDRIFMMEKYVSYYKLKNVTVDEHSGTIIRYAEEHQAQFLLRGLRNTTDFQMELELAAGNRGINKDIETICFFSKPHFATISSSLVRQLAMLGEGIDQYVLPSLTDFISEKINS
ncbi:MAG: pantetheine-phosphate adenylyltransferase [Halobacteriovoraceae bacterium]|nr:pantetheine-phosphate adenylyltransferase [Halobacteriovoraceae bacterium]MCB9095760.1 pantetheine-phosphate adenylyltransferase [Halobacteriovoraceae bacterium]